MSCEVSLISSLVRKCTTVTSLKPARQLHARILTAINAVSHNPTPYFFNNVLSMYAKCGSLRDAEKVFDEMPHRNIVSYNALISAYSRFPGENSVSAVRLIARMDSERLSPNGSTFTSLFHVLEDFLTGASLHCRAVKLGFTSDKKVQTSLIGMYSDSGDIASARKVFRWLSNKDAAAWNSIMIGNSKNGDSNGAIEAFREMLRSGACCPNHSTYSMALKLCGKSGQYRVGKQIHARIVISETRPDSALMNSLIDMYFNCDDYETAFSLFRRVQSRDLATWNSVISNVDSDEPMRLFVTLKGVLVNLRPDEYTFAAVVSATSDSPASTHGCPLHGQTIRSGFSGNVYVGSALVTMYFANGESREAEKVFDSVQRKDSVLWTDMIVGLSDMNSMVFLREMCRVEVEVDGFALSAAIGVCADVAMLRQGEMVQSRAVKTGYEAEMSVCGSLVDMYAKNGLVWAAREVFSRTVGPDLKCWNAMLSGYGRHGMAREAMEMFDEVQRHGFLPDEITFLSLLSACNHKGLVEQGKSMWDRMVWAGIEPGPKHYCCMVSLLSRAGLMDEAEAVIVNSPPFFGDKDVIELWRTLLSSCVVWNNLSVGVKAADCVLRLDGEDNATRVLLSNLYAELGEWDGVSCARRNVNGSGFEKDPGLSWLELQGTKLESEEEEFRLEHRS